MKPRRSLLDRLLPDGHVDEAEPSFDLRPAWRLGDRDIERDAIAFWQRLGILPPGVRPEDRAKELAAAAYRRARLVGVATVAIVRIGALRGRFAMLRAAVDPEHRRSHVALDLAVFVRELTERWSLAHPEEGVLGLGGLVEGTDLIDRARQPFWPRTGLGLVGYAPDGRQVRVAWYAHARID